MLRFLQLKKNGSRFELETRFYPSEDEVLDCNLPTTGCLVIFDAMRKSCVLDVHSLPALDLCTLQQLQTEILYIFQLLNSLSPHETSPSQKPQDQP